MKHNLAWHFVGKTLRDGSPVPADGVWLEHKGPLVMCESGLHFSRDPFDALKYAPGETLCLVEIGGEIVQDTDKGICSRRKIIARMDATELMRYFTRMRALSVIHLNKDLPEVVCDYLMTSDESLRDAAWAAARDATLDATWDAARAASRAAARAAAWAAAMTAAWAAAWAAARAAAWAAERDAAWAAARAATLDATWDAARQHFNELVRESFEEWL